MNNEKEVMVNANSRVGLSLSLMLFTVLNLFAVVPTYSRAGRMLEGRAIWAHPNDVARNMKSVEEFVAHCKRAHINLIIFLVKDTQGRIYWHSRWFSECIHPDWQKFDALKAIIREAHKKGIRVHAWLCDFTEGEDSPAYKEHPEWAMLNPEGKPTTSEMLGKDRPYKIVWMCPNRRPGYVDRWLLPMIEEILRNYNVDGIHHDYVRYPGDVAPDNYCFCDHCLEDYMRYNHFYYETFPRARFHPEPTLPNYIANWWKDYTVKPQGWEGMTQKEKANFILKGSSMSGGPPDLDYFFYEQRCDATTRFVRKAWQMAKKLKPRIQFSAAVFKNPMLSGRNIGQRWTDFAPWIDVMMPMCYRSHFTGDFATYLGLLTEYTQYENMWAANNCHVYVGITAHYIYKEEYEPLNNIRATLSEIQHNPLKNIEECNKQIQENYSKIKVHLASVNANLENEMSNLIEKLTQEIDTTRWSQIAAKLDQKILNLLRDPPQGYYPEDKLIKSINAVRRGGGEGIAIFAAGHIKQKKLWPALEKAFKRPSRDPDVVKPLGIQKLRRQLISAQDWAKAISIASVITIVSVTFLIY